ncbi:MAG: hypothetical protein IIX75_03955, partial [Clostridia bacterium]|nr:hypothetical protein [Clostridia bacterium]
GKGRKIIGWDEILEGEIAPNATIMSWRGEAGGIKATKHFFQKGFWWGLGVEPQVPLLSDARGGPTF